MKHNSRKRGSSTINSATVQRLPPSVRISRMRGEQRAVRPEVRCVDSTPGVVRWPERTGGRSTPEGWVSFPEARVSILEARLKFTEVGLSFRVHGAQFSTSPILPEPLANGELRPQLAIPQWSPMGAIRVQWRPVEANGSHWSPMESNGVEWRPFPSIRGQFQASPTLSRPQPMENSSPNSLSHNRTL